MGDGLFVHGGVTSAQEARLALLGLLALQGPTALDVRTGVLVGPGSTTLVTGTSATAPMQVAIGVHDAVLSRGSANGPYLMPTEAVQLVNIGAAPGSGTRIDTIYEKQQDNTPGVPTPDLVAPAPLYGVLPGTPAKANLATIVGAEEVATVAVSAGAIRTTDPQVLITNTARQTAARGGIIPVRDQADRDSITAYPAVVHRLDTGAYEAHGLTGSWGPLVADRPWTEIAGAGGSTYSYALPAAFATLPQMSVSVTVPAGRTLDVEWKAPSVQTFATSNADLQLLIGGAVQDAVQFSTGAAPVFVPGRLTGSIVGTGAAVAIAVQGRATAGSASVIGAGLASVKLRYRAW